MMAGTTEKKQRRNPPAPPPPAPPAPEPGDYDYLGPVSDAVLAYTGKDYDD